MVKRAQVEYVCDACGGRFARWNGQCPDCGAWNTLIETPCISTNKSPNRRFRGRNAADTRVATLSNIRPENASRDKTGMSEFDRVLGGGLVVGSVTLIGGDPGIGKSTLLLQAAAQLSRRLGVLYVTGEESLEQVGIRAERLGLLQAPLVLASETSVEAILALSEAKHPRVLIVDSVQTVHTEMLSSAPGSVAQLRESAAALTRYAKHNDSAVMLIGHVTKQGAIAGPRVLEHMVDTVLYFENDAGSRYRIIRAVKNRFGAANELGVFAMTESGLKEVKNPSAIFLVRDDEPSPGSVVTVLREGSRPLLVEVQALVDESSLANPRRVTVGFDSNRLAMLIAVLHRHAGIALFAHDIFINVVGGLRVSETGMDLAILACLLSSLRDRPLPSNLLLFGEVGLGGEIRPVYGGEERLAEAAAQGFKKAIVPAANSPRRPRFENLQVIPVTRLSQVLELLP